MKDYFVRKTASAMLQVTVCVCVYMYVCIYICVNFTVKGGSKKVRSTKVFFRIAI